MLNPNTFAHSLGDIIHQPVIPSEAEGSRGASLKVSIDCAAFARDDIAAGTRLLLGRDRNRAEFLPSLIKPGHRSARGLRARRSHPRNRRRSAEAQESSADLPA